MASLESADNGEVAKRQGCRSRSLRRPIKGAGRVRVLDKTPSSNGYTQHGASRKCESSQWSCSSSDHEDSLHPISLAISGTFDWQDLDERRPRVFRAQLPASMPLVDLQKENERRLDALEREMGVLRETIARGGYTVAAEKNLKRIIGTEGFDLDAIEPVDSVFLAAVLGEARDDA
jgi:hypothetical protein